MNTKKAFTIVELLVVLSVLAVILALLLPALHQAKAKAAQISCLNNLKQLGQCWHLYTADNNDILPPNNAVYVLGGSQPIPHSEGASWCLGNARMDLTASNIESGLLFQYNKNSAIYHCPADKSTAETSGGTKTSVLRNRSFSMSQSVNGYPEFDAQMSTLIAPSFKKLGEIKNPEPTGLFVFIDVHEDEIVDAMFGIPTKGSPFPQDSWWDIPANRHNQGCNLSFADGHVERWRWRTPKVFRQYLQKVETGEMEDYRRLQSAVKQEFK